MGLLTIVSVTRRGTCWPAGRCVGGPRLRRSRSRLRQLGTAQCFAEVKNRKPHDVPLSGSLAPILAEHIRQFPPVAVTLPWQVPDGEPVTFTLLVTWRDGRAVNRSDFNSYCWRPARWPPGSATRPPPCTRPTPT
jgi:hypothetical protein